MEETEELATARAEELATARVSRRRRVITLGKHYGD
jgi:hypothetical protein